MSAIVGSGDFSYEAEGNWGRGPHRPEFGLVSGVACDSQDRVYVFQRFPASVMMVFEPNGRLITSWGEGAFEQAHGVWMSEDDILYVTDTNGHTVTQWTCDGALLATWGTRGEPGAETPFNRPTRAFRAPSGEVFVADGYGNHRVHRFSADGELELSWGTEGTGPGEFTRPVHNVCVDERGRVLVLDRGNDRVQIFTRDGEYLDQWRDIAMPQEMLIDGDNTVYIIGGRLGTQHVTMMTLDGELIARWGEYGSAPGQFVGSPHGMWIDSRGDLYIIEVEADNRMQKFVRR